MPVGATMSGSTFADVVTASLPFVPPSAALAASATETARQSCVVSAPVASWKKKSAPFVESMIRPASPAVTIVPPA